MKLVTMIIGGVVGVVVGVVLEEPLKKLFHMGKKAVPLRAQRDAGLHSKLRDVIQTEGEEVLEGDTQNQDRE